MNKQQERAIVDAFVRFGGVAGLTVYDWNRERPDALLMSPDGLVGVEITALSEIVPRQASPTQQWLVEGDRLIEATRQAFEMLNATPVIVNIAMSADWRPYDRQVSIELAREIAALMDRALKNPSRWPFDEKPYQLHEPHPSVRWIFIGRSRSSSHWAPSIAGATRSASSDDVAHTVARKEPLVPAYRQAAPQVWLLIDCSAFGQGVALDVPSEPSLIRTGFDRVFCFGFGWRWVEVPVDKTYTAPPG